jgi:16S rRNA (uracil1498-N3)-methyltransferase
VKWARFFVPDLDPSAPAATLSSDESHHLVKVMRLGVGDEVAIFDGRGYQALARVETAASKAVTLRIVRPLPARPLPRIPIVLAQAVLKGDKMDDVVRDATMAGVSTIVPIVSERTLVSASALTRGHAVDRWQRVAIASAKQCGRAHLPEIQPPRSLDTWLGAPFDGVRVFLVEPSGDAVNDRRVRSLRDVLAPQTSRAVACIVGPEGGWTIQERQRALDAGCIAAALGSLTLRADAAGLVAVSLVSVLLEDS